MEAIYSVQKMADVLVAGPDTEREFILFELQQLLDHCLDDTMKILIPVLCEYVHSWNIDLQIKSAQRLFDVVCLDLDPATANMITCASFGVIHGSRGKAAPEYQELYNLWGGILVDCLPNMSWSPQEVKDVVALVDIHAKEGLYTSRKVAARVIGALAQCLEKSKVEKIVLPRAVDLFDDPDIEVRGTVVESLASVGAALPIRVTETEVWPLIERLLEPPEESRLRATAMRTMAHILESHREKSGPSRLFRDLLPPVFGRLSVFARKYSAEDQRLVDDDTYLLLEVASEVFGQFAYSLASYPRKSFRKEAYKAYAGMATCNGPLIRRNCAFNLPGVAKALGERYALELSGLCEYLAKDTDEEVRWILAAGIHETAALLAPKGNFERLFTAVCSLLQDENPMVRMNALAHFHDLLSAFAREGSEVRRLAPVFSDLNMLSEGEWRIQKSLAEQLGKCAEIIPADALLDNVIPLLYRLTEQGTPLVREAAMDAVAKAIRNVPSTRDRNLAIERYWKGAAKGPFWMRLALLDGGVAAMRVFSHERFRSLFAAQMLSLSEDPVANVRIRVASTLPSMAPMCSGMPEYTKAVRRLKEDTDIDVLLIMEDHEKNVGEVMRGDRERKAIDDKRYREEQEFYGITPRAQKLPRSRLNSGRGRLLLHVRRPSIDKSAAQLSVSKDVINAGKISSEAASARKPNHHPKLPETDSAVYLDPNMESFNRYSRSNGMRSTGSDEESILAALARDNETLSTNEHIVTTSALNGHRRVESRQRSINPEVKKVEGRNGLINSRQESTRSKSWNGMLANLPRQFSMESRRNKQGSGSVKQEDGPLSGWGSGGSSRAKKTLSMFRKRPKRRNASSRGEGSVGSESAGFSAEDFAVPGRTEMSNESDTGGVGVGRNDFASMGNLGMRVDGGGLNKYTAANSSKLGIRASTGDAGASYGGLDEGNTTSEMLDAGTGLPSFRGRPPWARTRKEGEDLDAISEEATRKALGLKEGSSGRSVISSFHNSAREVLGLGGSSVDGDNGARSSGGRLFRGWFRRRR